MEDKLQKLATLSDHETAVGLVGFFTFRLGLTQSKHKMHKLHKLQSLISTMPAHINIQMSKILIEQVQ